MKIHLIIQGVFLFYLTKYYKILPLELRQKSPRAVAIKASEIPGATEAKLETPLSPIS